MHLFTQALSIRWRALVFLGVLLIALTIGAHRSTADEGLSVTVTPPLIQLSIGPGETWTSSIKIVNNNTYSVTYYTQLVDMQADGEEGRSKFVPLVNEDQADPTYQSFALARWITLSSDPIVIAPGGSATVPFAVSVPPNAEPGGHYAAILVGTQPGSINNRGTLMKVSSYVSSLIFVEIKGNAVESGRIREFSTSKSLYQAPNVDFTVRFENTGNTHVHPQGQVVIYNMWGKERGQVLINNGDSDFGNVLPQSVRKFQFSWTGDQSIFDIGPYRAVVTLDFGSAGKQNVSATSYFWIVPLVPVSIAVTVIIGFVFLITWLIRRYIRRALALEKARYGTPAAAVLPVEHSSTVIQTLIEPLREGVIDLRNVRSHAAAQSPTQSPQTSVAMSAASPAPLSFIQFVKKYRLFFAFLLLCVALSIGLWWYLTKVLETKRGYQISNVTIESERIPSR